MIVQGFGTTIAATRLLVTNLSPTLQVTVEDLKKVVRVERSNASEMRAKEDNFMTLFWSWISGTGELDHPDYRSMIGEDAYMSRLTDKYYRARAFCGYVTDVACLPPDGKTLTVCRVPARKSYTSDRVFRSNSRKARVGKRSAQARLPTEKASKKSQSKLERVVPLLQFLCPRRR